MTERRGADMNRLFSEDDYGYYETDEDGDITLVSVETEDERKAYSIPEGCVKIRQNALKGNPFLQEITIPASVTEIPDGALSNSGSWAQTEKGITAVHVDPANKKFYVNDSGLFEKNCDGNLRLLLWLGKGNTAVISDEISEIGKDAFYGKNIDKVVFTKYGYSYEFPKHKFFREELLKSFGINNKLYDFSEYDSFLLRKHYSAERIRMLCERLEQPLDLSEEMREKLILHIREALDKVIDALAEENAVFELKYLVDLNILDKDGIINAIEILNDTDKREMLTYLMDYKNEKFGCDEFDFSI